MPLRLDSHADLIFAANGDLEDYVKLQPETSTESRLKFARKATEAVAYVHSKGVIHGDIAARRFLLDEQLNPNCLDSLTPLSWGGGN